MRLFSLILLVVCFGAQALADPSDRYSCIFEKPLIFGASISAGFGVSEDPRFTRAPEELRNHPLEGHFYGPRLSPETVLANDLLGAPNIINISELNHTLPLRGHGDRQFFSFVNNSQNHETVASVTVFSSMDAFYWPAGDANGSCLGVVENLGRMLEFSQNRSVPIILATVPDEDPSLVNFLLTRTGAWYPPNRTCLTEINGALKSRCSPESGCYLVDLHQVVADLNNPEAGVEFRGETYFYSDFRFDGVHLNDIGTEYIVSLIEEALSEGPNLCP